jgi:hypothetical protein
MWVTLTWKDTVDLIIVAALFYTFLLLRGRTHERFIVNAIGGSSGALRGGPRLCTTHLGRWSRQTIITDLFQLL